MARGPWELLVGLGYSLVRAINSP
ncbi:uncharacterized protein G2W53_018321 [Senna tora]|uniref:Uncharacterized protein n=1 Tax=Senna tora TaxID=362788 RepID=A0A834TTF0_9FABA|nr:uncharacterized protein G2W53_018321 [Senna tora]